MKKTRSIDELESLSQDEIEKLIPHQISIQDWIDVHTRDQLIITKFGNFVHRSTDAPLSDNSNVVDEEILSMGELLMEMIFPGEGATYIDNNVNIIFLELETPQKEIKKLLGLPQKVKTMSGKEKIFHYKNISVYLYKSEDEFLCNKLIITPPFPVSTKEVYSYYGEPDEYGMILIDNKNYRFEKYDDGLQIFYCNETDFVKSLVIF